MSRPSPGGPGTRRYRCEVCDYVYDEVAGEPREGFPPGTEWSRVPDDWCCPDCGVREKIDFLPVVDVVPGHTPG